MERAGITDPADVHYVQTKTPLLTIHTIRDAKSRGKKVWTEHTHESMDLSNGVTGLGIAVALGEIEMPTDEDVMHNRDLYSSVASCSSGVELDQAQIVVVGNAKGVGGKYRIRRMYRRLCERYHAGDTHIDIIGFSRGAAMALHFANVLSTHGIRNPKGPRSWLRYDPMFGWSIGMPKASASDPRPPIRFLGLFDTVASFGLPIGRLRNRHTRRWQVRMRSRT